MSEYKYHIDSTAHMAHRLDTAVSVHARGGDQRDRGGSESRILLSWYTSWRKSVSQSVSTTLLAWSTCSTYTLDVRECSGISEPGGCKQAGILPAYTFFFISQDPVDISKAGMMLLNNSCGLLPNVLLLLAYQVSACAAQ